MKLAKEVTNELFATCKKLMLTRKSSNSLIEQYKEHKEQGTMPQDINTSIVIPKLPALAPQEMNESYTAAFEGLNSQYKANILTLRMETYAAFVASCNIRIEALELLSLSDFTTHLSQASDFATLSSEQIQSLLDELRTKIQSIKLAIHTQTNAASDGTSTGSLRNSGTTNKRTITGTTPSRTIPAKLPKVVNPLRMLPTTNPFGSASLPPKVSNQNATTEPNKGDGSNKEDIQLLMQQIQLQQKQVSQLTMLMTGNFLPLGRGKNARMQLGIQPQKPKSGNALYGSSSSSSKSMANLVTTPDRANKRQRRVEKTPTPTSTAPSPMTQPREIGEQ